MRSTLLTRIEDGATTELDRRFMEEKQHLRDTVGIVSVIDEALKNVRDPSPELVDALRTLNRGIAEVRERLEILS